jgi:BirA family biotin operon repressor/biotin-[acetyl-CoA-carboxylase] ligase
MSRLLNLLQDGRFHSGEDLGRVLGISRSAVWKQLQLLEEDLGLEVHKVRGRGYRLAAPVSLLDAEVIAAALDTLGWDLDLHQVLDSTNAGLCWCSPSDRTPEGGAVVDRGSVLTRLTSITAW